MKTFGAKEKSRGSWLGLRSFSRRNRHDARDCIVRCSGCQAEKFKLDETNDRRSWWIWVLVIVKNSWLLISLSGHSWHNTLLTHPVLATKLDALPKCRLANSSVSIFPTSAEESRRSNGSQELSVPASWGLQGQSVAFAEMHPISKWEILMEMQRNSAQQGL